MKKYVLIPLVALAVLSTFLPVATASAARYVEALNRGVVAVYVPGSGVYVGWRMFGTDPTGIGFNVYRNGAKLTSSPVTTSTNYMDSGGSTSSTYYVKPVIGGVEQAASETVGVWTQTYGSESLRFKDVPIQRPADVVRPDGTVRTYSANDCSVGDLDGDGEYEIVLKWDPNDSKDNSQSGVTGNVYLDAYKTNGTRLWRIDLGINIRAGAHYTQFMVWDLNGDGMAEVGCKTAPGTKDGLGNFVIMGSDDPYADYRNASGYILTGPEYYTLFNGQTGANMVTIAYPMPRGNISDWGDSYGNRGDRYLACVAYLDGERPSLVECRGYYGPQSGYKGKNQLTALDWRNGQLTQRWQFTATINTGADVNPEYIGQGNHGISVVDADGDGYDEIIYGACVIDHDGAGKFSTGLGHGDAMYVSDLNPNRPGYEVWGIHEGTGNCGSALYDAADGTVLWKTPNADAGRCSAADIDPANAGTECWSNEPNLYNVTGTLNSSSRPSIYNFVIWWDGDLSRELSDADRIDKWNPTSHTQSRLLTVYNYGVSTNNGTKKNPCLQADIFGDWREEIIMRTTDSSALRIFTPVTVTSYRIHTLMHDPVYRMGIAWQNVAYNQPPMTSFFFGNGMPYPVPLPDIVLVSLVPDETPPTPDPMTWATPPYATSSASISMTATTASDASGVEYYFANLTITDLSHDSGWQSSPTFMDTGLNPSTTYTYCMAARDRSINHNITAPSEERSATTLVADTTPPTPDPMTWELYPYALDSSSITMAASVASDVSGVEYYFDCVSGGGHDSGWQSSPTYTDTGLSAGTTYEYAVQSRDKSVYHNVTGWSDTRSATTYVTGATTRYEAEDQFFYETVFEAIHAGYSGTGYANTNNIIGSYVEWTVSSPIAGSCVVYIRFANGTTTNRQMSIMVNGQVVMGSFDFPGTGAWTNWTTTFTTMTLSAGTNTIRLTSLIDGQGGPNLDYIDLTTPMADLTAPTPDPMEWVVVPTATSHDSITMTAKAAGDASGVEYYFANLTITDMSHDSGWQDSPVYTDTGLTNGTAYNYAMAARDKSPQENMTGVSTEEIATTLLYTCQSAPASDMSSDCRVDFTDFAMFAGEFAVGGAGSPGNFNGDSLVDFGDLAVMASEWLECGREPATECP